MRHAPFGEVDFREPQLIDKARQLGSYLKTLSVTQLAKSMKISPALAKKTQALMGAWTAVPTKQSLAIDSFIGDIYSGLQALHLSSKDRDYADKTLRILSGLYGIIRPYDGICPYRLEMGYTLPDGEFSNLYKFWGDSIASCLPKKGVMVNLASEEFFKTITPFVDEARVVVPQFLTINPKTNKPTFVVVHAKIARGAFARWMIMKRIQDVNALVDFKDLGYLFNQKLSTKNSPTFVCQTFGGKGLSIK